MTCHGVSGKDKDGRPFFAIACTRGKSGAAGGKRAMCDVQGCSTPYEKLCDWPVPGPEGKPKTCDQKLCKAHAHNVGPDRDYCPTHHVEHRKGAAPQGAPPPAAPAPEPAPEGNEYVHYCHARPYCKAEVPRSMFACRPHWFMLPKAMRDAIWRGYREDPLGSGHLDAMKRATAWLHDRLKAKEAGQATLGI